MKKDRDNIATFIPCDSTSTPSSAMLGHIEMLMLLLEMEGVDVSEYREEKRYKTRYSETKQMIHALHKVAKENGVDWEGRKIQFVNLCRDKNTKKKIKYKTSYRLGHPAGYEYLGTLSQTIIDERNKHEEIENRTRDDNQLQSGGADS